MVGLIGKARKDRDEFYFFKYLENIGSIAQGKGIGSVSISNEVEFALKILGHEPTLVVDIGANVGDYTAEILRKSPSSEIHLFEPAMINVSRLQKRFENFNNVFVVPVAVSNSEGEAFLYSDKPGSGLASISNRNLKHFKLFLESKEKIKSIKFQTYWKDILNSRHIDLMKLDIEGSELRALSGAGNAVKFTKVIQFEFGGANIDTKTFFQDFWYFFSDHNFTLYRISPLGPQLISEYSETDEIFRTTNFLAVNKDLF